MKNKTEKELKGEIEKKLNKFKKKQGIKGKQKHQYLLDSEIIYFAMDEIQERNAEVKQILKHAIEILKNNYCFRKSDNMPKKDKQAYKEYMIGAYNRIDELGLIYSSIENISFNESIKALNIKDYFDEIKELLQKLGLEDK